MHPWRRKKTPVRDGNFPPGEPVSHRRKIIFKFWATWRDWADNPRPGIKSLPWKHAPTQPQPPDQPPAANQIFRQEVLDRLSSPEQLNLLMRVTDGKGWLALLACGLILATALVWGVFGRVPTKVTGSGILLPLGGLAGLVAVADGQLTTLEVKPGDQVTRGQVVARLAQPDLVNQIDGAAQAAARAAARPGEDPADGNGRTPTCATRPSPGSSRACWPASPPAAPARAELEERLANERMLQKRGILPRATVQATRQELRAAEASERAMRGRPEAGGGGSSSPPSGRPETRGPEPTASAITEMERQIKLLEERLAPAPP